MPNYLQLYRHGQPVAFQQIDLELCNLLGREAHPKYWVEGWYDIIGFALACGRDWDWIVDTAYPDDYSGRKIVGYLREEFTINTWWQHV